MATKRIKDITNTGSEDDLKSENFLALDGPNGTKKIPGDTFTPSGRTASISSSIAPEFDPDRAETYPAGYLVMHEGELREFIVDHPTGPWISGDNRAANVAAQIATIGPNGVFIGSRKIHPGSKLFVEGLPVDSVDYALVEKYNAFIYNRITALATSGTVTLGLWNYDTKTYVSEQQFSTDSDNPTVIDVSAVNASDTMEIHLKGTGTIDSIVGSIV